MPRAARPRLDLTCDCSGAGRCALGPSKLYILMQHSFFAIISWPRQSVELYCTLRSSDHFTAHTPAPESVGGLASARSNYTNTGLVIPSRPVSAVYAPTQRSLDGSQRAGLHSAWSSRGMLTDRSTKSDFIPTFAALDRKLLRFDAFFSEAIPNSPYESERVRKSTMLF